MASVGAGRRDPGSVFTHVYAKNIWGGTGGGWNSGGGSETRFVDPYVEVIAALARDLSVKTLVDLGCGDFRVGARLCAALPHVSYTGIDVVGALVEHNRRSFGSDRVRFVCSDMTRNPVESAELCLIRQTLQHLSNREIAAVLDAVACFPLVVVTEHVLERPPPRGWNTDIPHGALTRVDRRSSLRLDLPPFNTPTGSLLLRQSYRPGEYLDTFTLGSRQALGPSRTPTAQSDRRDV